MADNGDKTSVPDIRATRAEYTNLATSYGLEELHRLAALFRSGQWPQSDLLEAKASKAALYDRMTKRGLTRQRAARLAITIAQITEAPADGKGETTEPSHPYLVELASPLVEWTTRSDRFRDKLTRSTVGAPAAPISQAPGKLESWMVANQPCRRGEDPKDLMAWRVGDGALVWWGTAWFLGYVQEIGSMSGAPTLRLRLLGFDSSSDLWVKQSDWMSRVRPVTAAAAGFGRLARGHCGRVGDCVAVDLVEGCESTFWSNGRRPVGTVVRAIMEHDAVEVELCGLAVTEAVVVANSVCKLITAEEHAAAVAHVELVRTEGRRLLDALLATTSALPSADSAAKSGHPNKKNAIRGTRVWCGVRVISGHRLLVSVLRRQDILPVAEEPQWHARFFDPAARDWHELTIPKDKLAAAAMAIGIMSTETEPITSSSAIWETCDDVSASKMGAEVSRHLRARDGVIEWSDECHAIGSTPSDMMAPTNDHIFSSMADDMTSSSPPAIAQALQLPAAFPPMRGSEELQRVRGLVLRGISCELTLVRGGSGDYQESSDGCRLVIALPKGAGNRHHHENVLVLGRADWQWYRPHGGTNAGALPGVRWLSRRMRKALVKGLVARLDTYQGVACLRLPHRTVYPLGFVPLQATPPPSSERVWASLVADLPPLSTISLVWRAGIVLEAPQLTSLPSPHQAKSRRWMVSMWDQGEVLRVCAMEPRRKTRLSLSLKHEHWLSWGFGPLPWLSIEQKRLLARRLMSVLHLTASKKKEANNEEEEFQLAANFAPIFGYCGDMSIADAGTVLILSWPKNDDNDSKDGTETTSRRQVVVSARDLKACCPSLQVDPFQASAAATSASAAPGVACGLGPLRFPMPSNRLRPGYSGAALAADDADCAAAWEEVRLTAGLRDMEPLPRQALLRRAVLTLQRQKDLSTKEEGGTLGDPQHPRWLSYPPAMPSATCEVKVTTLEVTVDAPRKEVTLSVAIAPPVPLWSTGSALDACTLRFSTYSILEVEVAAITRGLMQKVKVDGDSQNILGSIWDTVTQHHKDQVNEASSQDEATHVQQELDSSGQVHALVVVLQQQAGKQARPSSEASTSFSFASVAFFPRRPLRVHLHDVTATFVRTPPLQLSCFDTGRGILITAKERPGGYEQITSEEMGAANTRNMQASSSSREKGGEDLEVQQRLLEAASTSAAALTSLNRAAQKIARLEKEYDEGAIVAECQVPRAKLQGREPLLMTFFELERLMLGYTSKAKWRERRHHLRRCDFLSLPLDAALLGHKPPDEGAPGLVQWAAPFRGGSAVVGTVTKVHEDGMVDVSVTGSLEVLKRVPPADVRMPLSRPLNLKLKTLASSAHDFKQLNNAASSTFFSKPSSRSHPPPLLSGPSEASSLSTSTMRSGSDDDHTAAALVVGSSVLVRGKKQVLNQGSTKSLMYHRGTEAYVAAVSGDGYVVPSTEGKGRLLSALPEHLMLLLDLSTDADASTAPHVHDPSEFDEMVEDKNRVEDDDDHSFTVHESFSISARSDASSIHSDTLTVNKKRKKKARQVTTVPGGGEVDDDNDEEEEAEEDIAYREQLIRREKMVEATNAFYRRQAKILEEKGDESFAMGETLEKSQLQPTELADEWQEDDVALALATAHELINRGETEDETRKRALKKHACFVEAAQFYRQALMKWKDPRLYGRLARTLLRTKQFSEALDYAEKALEAFPTSAKLCFIQGQAHLSMKKPRAALKCFEKAKLLGKRDKKGGLDKKLVDKYLRLAITSRKDFVPFDDVIGDWVPEARDPIQRDIDQRLNVYNMYDSVPALVKPNKIPLHASDVPSKMVNPIALRIRHQGKRVPSERRRASACLVAVDATGRDQDDEASSDDDHSTAGRPPVLAVEEDDQGESDTSVLFEVELATSDGRVLELTVAKNQPIAEAVDAFLACHIGVLTPKQAIRLKRDLMSRTKSPEQRSP